MDRDKVTQAVANVKNFPGLTGNITINPKTHMPEGLEMVMFSYDNTTPKFRERYAAK